MPNREGGYGGYQKKTDQQRQIHAPGTGGVRRISPDTYEDLPNGRQPRTAHRPVSGAQRRRQPEPRQPQPRRAAYRPARPAAAEPDDGWIRPPQPTRRSQPRPQADPARDAMQDFARRARQDRRLRRRLTIAAVAVCILLASAAITAILPDEPHGATAESAQDATAGLTASLVAPLPYANGSTGDGQAAALDWGDVGPARQTETYTYTAAPAVSGALPAFGRVDLSWFADAAFLGDSLTVGFTEYDIDLGGALVCAYEGATPNQIVNRATMNSAVRGEEVTMDVLTNAQPKKLYILLGANALAYTENDEGFLNYYDRMLDELKAALPNTAIFVQSVLPVQAEALATMPGLAPDRVARINASLQTMAAEKGCYYLALNEAFSDDSGYLISDYAQPDGLHLSGSGYTTWVDYLCTHVPYDKDNPYQAGSEFYLDDTMKSLLSDLP